MFLISIQKFNLNLKLTKKMLHYLNNFNKEQQLHTLGGHNTLTLN